MNKNIFLILSVILLYLIPKHSFAQSDFALKLRGKFTQEYRSNFIRLPDSLKLSDHRTNLFLNAEHQQKIWRNGKLGLIYELRYHNYDDYHGYNRHDHLGNIKFQNPIKGDLKLHVSDEFRARFSATERYSYYRNIFDVYINLPLTVKDRANIGFQNWMKIYPHTSDFKKYLSNRIYSKLNLQLTRTVKLGIKVEFHLHEGNLYPGSSTPNLSLDLDGNRYVFQGAIDKMFSRKIFTSFIYRFEKDIPADMDYEAKGEHIGDENDEELLAEDSDFGYLKNQGAVSALFKLNSHVSIMAFYLVYYKNFEYWHLEPDGPTRHDRLIFLSHILRINLYKSITLELQHIYENNETKVNFYEYHFNSYAAGLAFYY